ncbi:superoxide dismutase family protein [Spirosoma arcticum]
MNNQFTTITAEGRRRTFYVWSGVALLFAGLLGCADHNPQSPTTVVATATVDLVNTSGSPVGSAVLTQAASGEVTINLTVSGLPRGPHGIHFHEVGVADPKASPPFSSSGEHYNPAARKHGFANPQGTHAGDLQNIEVDAQGKGTLLTTTDRVTLTDGANTLLDGNGSSLIIHANTDDYVTDPAGNTGGRIAGGVLNRK